MNASCQTLPSLYTPEIYDQVIVAPIEPPPLILISEKEYLELKSEVGYWRAMHQKAILREKKHKQTIKEQEGQIRDLRNRLFGKKVRKKVPVKMKVNQNPRIPNVPVVSNSEVRGMDVQSVPIFPRKKKWQIYQKIRYALNAVKPIYLMKVRQQKSLKLKSRLILVKSYAVV